MTSNILKQSALFALAAYSATTLAASLFTEDFQSGYNTGNWVGQQGWVFGSLEHPATIEVENGTFYGSSTSDSRTIKQVDNFGLTTSSVITLMFDLYVGTGTTFAAFGVSGFQQTPAMFGIQGGNWMVRPWGFGTTVPARQNTPPPTTIQGTEGSWYRVQSVWDLAGEGSATLAIMNLTAGETEFTQLFFDTDQTISSVSLGISASDPVTGWDGVYVRIQNGGVDNLSVIPEPSTYAAVFGLLALAGACLVRRRRLLDAAK